MSTHPVGKGTQTIGVNMQQEMADDIRHRAASMHISASSYVKAVMRQWLASGQRLRLEEQP